MATRKREIGKYQQTARGRYAQRVTLDSDIVIEIDHKTRDVLCLDFREISEPLSITTLSIDMVF